MWDVDKNRNPKWIVYNNPSDYPGQTLARLWYSWPWPAEATQTILVGTLQVIRAALSSHNYSCVACQPGDDPVIVEIWQ